MKLRNSTCLGVLLLLACLCLGDRPFAATSEPQVKPGDFVIDHPTLINLGFEWVIQGDDNRNAQVEVSYRRQGESAWIHGMPLLRLHGERIYQQGSWDVVSPNMFAGSILDLEPDTAYEARFVMSDPDGIAGQGAKTVVKTVTKTVTVRTRGAEAVRRWTKMARRRPIEWRHIAQSFGNSLTVEGRPTGTQWDLSQASRSSS